MLCEACFRMLRGQGGRIWKGTFDLHFNHHDNGKDLIDSARMHCGICRVLYEELQSKFDDTIVIEDQPLSIAASLSVIDHPRVQHLYRLDFKLRCGRIRGRRTFVLKRTEHGDPPFRTPISHHTSSDEVYQLSREWMSKCKCAPDKPPSWYPARLISLEELKSQDFLDTRKLVSISKRDINTIDRTLVKLVETNEWIDGWPGHENVRYVTLSHCWGPDTKKRLTLTSDNISDFKKGIQLTSLPKTFRDAIEFAARLPRVGYIWIDSLCIKQGPEEIEDWLIQSATMGKVYSETFLNISATAATSSDEGLFFGRSPELLLEDEVILNIEGLPGANGRQPTIEIQAEQPPETPARSSLIEFLEAYWLASFLLLLLRQLHLNLGLLLGVDQKAEMEAKARTHSRSTSTSVKTEVSRNSSPSRDSDSGGLSSDSDHKTLRRCTILDVSFWTNHVDRASVNRRGWVLQERLMAPRVLHFCHDQVAWECSEFDAAEGQPQGMPKFQLTSNGIVEESRLKGLDVKADGKRLRRIRLQGYEDPDLHMQPEIYALELWRRIVEVYSMTAITNDNDKLIALSGIARWMARKIGTPKEPARYVAGMWVTYLASQLLWKIDPVFREIDSHFEHPSTPPKKYRAPSFSWASIDADKGHGVTYAEITDRDLFINVEKWAIRRVNKADEYGMIAETDKNGQVSSYIVILGKLRRARLFKNPLGRFGWSLVDREELDAEEHANVYLDCPTRDENDILGPEAGVYIVPAAKGERTASEESKYVTCLILQLVKGKVVKDHEKGPAFRRIGLTKLSPWADHKALHNLQILEVYGSDMDMPHQGYDQNTGMHRIVII